MFGNDVGTRLGPYRLVELIGQGGMSAVYRAEDDSGTSVALKVLHYARGAEPEFVARFEREARVLTRLRHPHVVTTLSYDMSGSNPYIALQLLRGGTLAQRLAALAERGERLSLAETVRIGRQIAAALTFAHEHGLVHRDIKADNILFDLEDRAYLTDFGLVRLLGTTRHTITGGMVGTPAYMSPEQALGRDGDARSDLYALGVLLYQMATGVLPFAAEQPLAVVLQHINEPPVPPTVHVPDLSPDLAAVILRLMAKEPADRYPLAAAVAAALAAIESGQPETAAPAAAGGAGQSITARFAWLALALFLLLLIVSGMRMRAATGAAAEQVAVGATAMVRAAGAGAALPTPSPPPTVEISSLLATTTAETRNVVAVPVERAAVAGSASPVGLGDGAATPEPLLSPSPSPTPDVTATYIAECEYRVELVNVYTALERSRDAFAGRVFDISFVLRNVGRCRLPAGLVFKPVNDSPFQIVRGAVLSQSLPVSGEQTLRAQLRAPDVQARVEDNWGLMSIEGEAYANPISFYVDVYLMPTPTPTPTATPVDRPIDLTYTVESCEYLGEEWRCLLTLQPYGGGGGPYVIEVYDAAPSMLYRDVVVGQPHWITARRCDPWVKEIRVALNSEAGEQLRRTVVIDPRADDGIVAALGGPCTLP